MKKELLLLLGSSILSITIALLAFYYFYPKTFRRPIDMEIVQLEKKLPPFYMGVFRAKDIQATDPILKDPISNVRGKPFLPEIDKLGPHDILGFRNNSVPRLADVITIGDSQTYGMNATLLENWPSRLQESIPDYTVYNMALGGFSAPQYLQLVEYAMLFKPQVIVLALYSGNDPLESFRTVYNIGFWKSLRKDSSLSNSAAPETPSPQDESHWWKATFPDGSTTVFTPGLRLSSHLRQNRAVQAGYNIIYDIIDKVSKMATVTSTPVLVTILPSKELVYEQRIADAALKAPSEYLELVSAEKEFIENVRKKTSILQNVEYVDALLALQSAALKENLLYPPDRDGHPLPAGYKIIAETLTPKVEQKLKIAGDGYYRVPLQSFGRNDWYFVVRDQQRWFIPDPSYLQGTRYESMTPLEVPYRLIERYPLASLNTDALLSELRRN